MFYSKASFLFYLTFAMRSSNRILLLECILDLYFLFVGFCVGMNKYCNFIVRPKRVVSQNIFCLSFPGFAGDNYSSLRKCYSGRDIPQGKRPQTTVISRFALEYRSKIITRQRYSINHDSGCNVTTLIDIPLTFYILVG